MTTRLTRGLIVAALLLVLGVVNWSIFAKERIKSQGDVILLELAPVDPRSLMQGDYMALRFRLADQIAADESGSASIVLDGSGVAQLAAPGTPGARPLRFRLRHGQVWLGTNAYFFEEGMAERYADARYGEFRLDRRTGEAVLTGLRDAGFRPL